jgi:hypothetical protein
MAGLQMESPLDAKIYFQLGGEFCLETRTLLRRGPGAGDRE